MDILDKAENIVKEEGLILIVSGEMRVKRMGPFIQVMVGRKQEMIIALDEEDKGFEKILILFREDSSDKKYIINHEYECKVEEEIRNVIRKRIGEIIERSER